MLASIDARHWNNRPTSLDFVLPARSFDADVEDQLRLQRQDLEERTARPTQVRNVLIVGTPNTQPEVFPTLVRPLRVTVEVYGQDGAIAFLTTNKSYSGFGESQVEAVNELMNSLLHDFRFYQTTPDDALTVDAQESKAFLRELFFEQR